MLEKRLLIRCLSRLKGGGVCVKFWDNTSQDFGLGKANITIVIHRPDIIKKLIQSPRLGFAAGYISGAIEVQGDLSQLIRIMTENTSLLSDRYYRRNRVHRRRHQSYIERHYDLGNDFFGRWLDPTMLYTCAWFETGHENLEQAQKQKTARIFRQLGLKKDHTLLDIGCGWGYLSVQAAKQFGAKVTGLTLSREQLEFCQALAKKEKVEALVNFELVNFLDYQPKQSFDRVVSLECLESVGQKYIGEYLRRLRDCLEEGGQAVLQTSTMNSRKGLTEPFLDKYIFSGVYVPAQWELIKYLTAANLSIQRQDNLRSHYARTTEAWLAAYRKQKAWVCNNYNPEFYRLFELYLAGMVGTAYYSDLETWQLVLEPAR